MDIIFSIIAGVLVSLQSIFNTRLSEKVGLAQANAIVHGTGFVLALVLALLAGSGGFRKIGEVNKIYLLGGIFGVVIVFSVMKSVSRLGANYAIAILLVTQLITATVVDTLGLFGSHPMKLDFTKPLGVAVMIMGIVIFKLRG